MSEVVTAAPAPPVVRLPPAVRGPKLFQGLAFVVSRRRLLGRFVRRYGKAFTANILMYGRVVVVADPQLARQVFTSSPEELGNIQPNLSRMFGSGSVFALDGDDHRRRRRLLAPPFHGKSMKNYETIIEEETLRETANWPQGQAFATLPSMMHITLNAILRAIFGAGGSELDELRRLIPPWVTLGSRLAALPKPKRDYGRLSPWGRLAEWRRQYDTVIDKLIEAERADPNFADRTDVLALMLRTTTVPSCRARTLATSCSRCWPPGTKPRRRHWAGRSSGSAGTPTCSRLWSRRSTTAVTSCVKRRSWRYSGPGPSSILRLVASIHPFTSSASG